MSKRMPKGKKEKVFKRPKGWIGLDLACGNNKQKGFKGVDITKKGTQADIEYDLTIYPWPFKDESVDEIWASHYIEHLPHGVGLQDGMVDFMNECWRILKKSGIARFLTPYYANARAFQDPYHTRFITESSYLYFNKQWRKMNKLEHYPIKTDFQIEKMDHSISQTFIGRAQEAIQQMAMININVVDDLLVMLRKPK